MSLYYKLVQCFISKSIKWKISLHKISSRSTSPTVLTALGCDNVSPASGGEGGGDRPPSTEDKKPPLNDIAGVVKSETDSFLDSFDSKDGGKISIRKTLFLY